MNKKIKVTFKFINVAAVIWSPMSFLEVYFIILTAETLYHPGLRQAIFKKEEFHYLNAPKVGKYTVLDAFDCTFECLSNPSCFSFNLASAKEADDKIWCELLSADKHSNPKDYTGNQSSHHFFTEVGNSQRRLKL